LRKLTLLIPLVASGAIACGSTEVINPKSGTGAGAGAGPATSSSAAGGDASSGDTGGSGGGEPQPIPYPAPHPSMPEIPKHGGSVLHDPVIVTVTFPGDPLEGYLQTFDDAIGQTPWWTAANGEYGVGAATGGAHVVLTEPAPDTITDSGIRQWLAAKVVDGTLPEPTDQTIFALYYPSSTTITLDVAGGGVSCNDFGAYHFNTNVTTATNTKVNTAYAVMPRCGGGQEELTVSASHEFAEAATDPHPGSSLAYVLTTDGAWNPAGGETADMCEFVSGVQEGDYYVTRVWSNKNAKIGQQPCVPVPPDPANLPYYNAGIVNEELDASPGDTVTTDVDCYSFDKLPNPITLEAQSFSGTLQFEFDPPTCENGTVVKMSIHVAPTAKSGHDYHYRLLSTLNADSQHLWRGMVSVK